MVDEKATHGSEMSLLHEFVHCLVVREPTNVN